MFLCLALNLMVDCYGYQEKTSINFSTTSPPKGMRKITDS